MKFVLFISCLLIAVHYSTQKSFIEDGCTPEMLTAMGDKVDQCFKITCSTGEARNIACMNDVCPPGQNPKGREPDDNEKTYPACCGQLICE